MCASWANWRAGWRRFVRSVYAPLLAQYGFDPRAGAYAGQDPERSQRRVQIVGRLVNSARDATLRRALDKAALRYLAGDAAALDPAWFDLAFGAHLGAGKGNDGLARAQALVSRALASEDPVFRPAALDAVGGSGNKAVARWVLDGPDDPRLRPSEKRGMLNAVMLS